MRNTCGDREGRLRFLLSKMVDWTCCVGLGGLPEQKQMSMKGLLIMQAWHARLGHLDKHLYMKGSEGMFLSKGHILRP